MERSIAQQIMDGSSNFRAEIEKHLGNAESTFGKLNQDVSYAMKQVELKVYENDGESAKFEGMLQTLIEKQQQTQKVLEQERAKKGRR